MQCCLKFIYLFSAGLILKCYSGLCYLSTHQRLRKKLLPISLILIHRVRGFSQLKRHYYHYTDGRRVFRCISRGEPHLSRHAFYTTVHFIAYKYCHLVEMRGTKLLEHQTRTLFTDLQLYRTLVPISSPNENFVTFF